MTALATTQQNSLISFDEEAARSIADKVIAENGNLARLTAVERKQYYMAMCNRFGLDPYSNPWDYMEGKNRKGEDILTLYPNKKAAETFGNARGLSIKILDKSLSNGTAIVTVSVSDGRREVEEIGAVELTTKTKFGERSTPPGDALKKALTQARRRGILAFCGFSADGDENRAMPAEALDPPLDAIDATFSSVPELTSFNRQPTMDAIASGIKRLGWTRKQGSDYLKEAYGKATRDEMTDAELIDFADYLDSFKTPVTAPKPISKPLVLDDEESAIDTPVITESDEFPTLD